MLHPIKHSTCKAASSFITPLFLLLILFVSACDRNSGNITGDQTFTKILDSANHSYDMGNYDKTISLLDASILKYKNVSVADHFEFLRLHCDYYFHVKKDNDKAMFFADSMMAIIVHSPAPQNYNGLYAIACFSKGDVFFSENKYTEAFQFYYLGRLTGKNSFDNCTLSDYSYRMGMIKYKQEHYLQAADFFKQGFSEGDACKDNFSSFYRKQELLDNAALCYSKINDISSAENYYTQALAYIAANEKKFPSYALQIDMAKGVIYGNYAQVFMLQHKYSKAETMLKKSIQINLHRRIEFKDAQLAELKLAHLYQELSNTDSLVVLMDNLSHQLDSVKNDVAEIDWNLIMANYYQKKDDHKNAFAYFTKYDRLKDSLNEKNSAIKAYDANKEFKAFDDQREIAEQKKREQLEHIYLTIEAIVAFMAMAIIILIYQNWKRSKSNVITLSDLNAKINDQNDTLQKAFSELEDNNKEKDRIMHAVAHDLRNPIGGIASLTALMIDDAEFDGEQKELLDLIQTATQNSLELINEILEATGNISGKASKRQMVDINTLLSNSIELLRFKAAEKNQKIMLEVLEAPEELLISREKIWRVVSNLISNAIKFSPNGSTIHVKISEQNDNIQIEVNDNGIGIPDNIKNLVFNMFTEAKRPGTNGEKSFGLGLSISKQIIESHGGQIWFQSMPNHGTTFYIRLKKYKAILE